MRRFEFLTWLVNAAIHIISFAYGNPVSWISYFCTLFCLLLHLYLEVREEKERQIIAKMIVEKLNRNFDNSQKFW